HATPSATKKQSVSYTQTEFIEEIAPTIQKVAASYGVRPSIIIAQAVLESNYGTNLLAVKYHNLFAVQAQDGQTAIELTYKSYFVNEWQ
ncbi:glucosaminidase domain-containing protein, partial [Streptococcus suis]